MPDKVTINTRYMPTLGNGNLAVTVYDNVMYLNGLYNGEGGNNMNNTVRFDNKIQNCFFEILIELFAF